MVELDVAGLDDAREAWRSGQLEVVQTAPVSAMTLGAAIEAATWAATARGDVRGVIENWSASVPLLGAALTALTSDEELPRPDHHEAPVVELRRCPSREELADAAAGLEWTYFLDRFRRSLTSRLGLPASRARGVSAALHEMVDNVVQHAGLGSAPRGVVAYDFSADQFGFAVADLGRGIRASLAENPVHAAIANDADALLSAVTRGASRRAGAAGRGFADLLRTLMDMAGTLSFRSGCARLRLDGQGAGSRLVSSSNSPELKGFQLSASVSPKRSSW